MKSSRCLLVTILFLVAVSSQISYGFPPGPGGPHGPFGPRGPAAHGGAFAFEGRGRHPIAPPGGFRHHRGPRGGFGFFLGIGRGGLGLNLF